MKNTYLFTKVMLIAFMILFGSIISLSAQQGVSTRIYKSSLSLGLNYALVPKWDVKTTTSLTLSYQRRLKNPSFSVEANLDMLGFVQPETPNQQTLPSSLIEPLSIGYYMYSALLSYSFLNDDGSPRNFGFYAGPAFRLGHETYHQQMSSIDGLILSRKASDWGVAAKIVYHQPFSKRFGLKLSGQYQYYFSNRPSEDYDFEASARVFHVGGALVFKL